jgi:hypothetical protein
LEKKKENESPFQVTHVKQSFLTEFFMNKIVELPGCNDCLGLQMGLAATTQPCRSGVVGYWGCNDRNARSGRH